MGLFRKKFTIVVVCRANITRSAYLRGYMTYYLKQHYPKGCRKVLVLSAGMRADCGYAASEVVKEVARMVGFSLAGHRSYPLDRRMVDVSDVMLVMELRQKQEILRRFPDAKGKTFCLTEYLGGEGARITDVPDPTGMGGPDYERFIKMVHAEVARIFSALEQSGIL